MADGLWSTGDWLSGRVMAFDLGHNVCVGVDDGACLEGHGDVDDGGGCSHTVDNDGDAKSEVILIMGYSLCVGVEGLL